MNSMFKRTCPDCGGPLPSGVFGETCPKCQFGSALAPDGLGVGASAGSAGSSVRGVGISLAELSLTRVGDYELCEEIGRGGMGVVFKARQISLNRWVALKMTLAGPLAPPKAIERFRAEAETVAQLRHPNIVTVHEIGEFEGRLYFSMDYVPGSNLAMRARETPFSAREAATQVAVVAETMAYAHELGVLHRDLKPSNVLIDESNQPRITDFGLAKRLCSDSDLTLSGQTLGSPSFCAPEQAVGQRAQVGPHSDVYSLGAILYYLITGRPPLLADTLEQTIWQVLHTEPASPRLLNPSMPADLETICLKCLEKSPTRRYQTAKELADELKRFLRGEPILASPLSRLSRTWRWCQRQPARAMAIASIAGLLVTVSAIVSIASMRLAHKERVLRERTYAADMRAAQQALEASNFGLANYHLKLHWPRPVGPDLRGWEWRYLWGQALPETPFRIGRHDLVVSALAFSPDGTRLVTGGSEGELKLWDFLGQRLLATYRSEQAVTGIAISGDGRSLAAGGHWGAIRIWSLSDTSAPPKQLEAKGRLLALSFSPDGQELTAILSDPAGGWMQSSAITWTIGSGARTGEVELGGGRSAALAPDGALVATGGAHGRVRLWSRISSSELAFWTAHVNDVNALVFSPDGRWLVSAGHDNTTEVWAVPLPTVSGAQGGDTPGIGSAPRLAASLVGSDGIVSAASFSSDGQYLATASDDQTVHLWETSTWREVALLKGHLSGISSVAFSPADSLLVTGGKGGEVRMWNPFAQSERSAFSRLPTGGRIVHLDDRVAAVVVGGEIVVMQLPEGTESGRFAIPATDCTAAALSADGHWAAAGASDGSVQLWNLHSFDNLARLRLDTKSISKLKLSSGGKYLCAIIARSHIRFLDVEAWRGATAANVPEASGDQVHSAPAGGWDLSHGGGPLTDVDFSPDSRWLAVGTEDGSIVIGDVTRRKVARTLKAQVLAVTDLAFSPDSRRLAASSEVGTIDIWDPQSGRKVAAFEGSGVALWSVSWSPDGRRLATGTGDRAILIWDVTSQQILVRLKGHTHSLVRASFLSDSDTLASYAADELLLWQAAPATETE